MDDTHDLNKFKPNDVHTFIDIGANDGSISIMARNKFPNARIIALEPCLEPLDSLKKNASNSNFEYHHVAIGPGTPLYFKKGSSSHFHRFLNESEKHEITEDTYAVESKTLPQIFSSCNIMRGFPYMIKSDCQGGEKYMFTDAMSFEILKESRHIMLEIHLPYTFSGLDWNPLIEKLRGTHNIRFRGGKPFTSFTEQDTTGNRYVFFTNKNWKY